MSVKRSWTFVCRIAFMETMISFIDHSDAGLLDAYSQTVTGVVSDVAESVVHIESAGEVEPWMTTIGHGPSKVPVRLQFS